jgi:predicted dehydrogenase
VPKGHPETGYLNEEEMYNGEIKAFLDAIKGKKKYQHTFIENTRLLKILYALEESNRTGRVVSLKNT